MSDKIRAAFATIQGELTKAIDGPGGPDAEAKAAVKAIGNAALVVLEQFFVDIHRIADEGK